MKREDITPKIVRELLDYDPKTGALTWRERPGNARWNGRFAGKVAGCTDDDGRIQVRLHGVIFKAHRVCWCHYHGKWPEHEIDHIHGLNAGNGIANLRDVPHASNQKNMKLHSRNRSGTAGVFRDKQTGKWRAMINVGGKNISLGRHTKKTDAIEARKAAEREHNFHKNHGRAAS